MRRFIALILALFCCGVFSLTAFAADIDQDSADKSANTTLTTSKAASYLVVIPESAEITFDTEVNPIGDIQYVSGNLEPDAYVTVSLSQQTELVNEADNTYTIDYVIKSGEEDFTSVVYNEDTAAGTKTPLTVNITKEAWEAAKAGEYAATLTFEISYTDPNEVP